MLVCKHNKYFRDHMLDTGSPLFNFLSGWVDFRSLLTKQWPDFLIKYKVNQGLYSQQFIFFVTYKWAQ
jgi:hypothetical protein